MRGVDLDDGYISQHPTGEARWAEAAVSQQQQQQHLTHLVLKEEVWLGSTMAHAGSRGGAAAAVSTTPVAVVIMVCCCVGMMEHPGCEPRGYRDSCLTATFKPPTSRDELSKDLALCLQLPAKKDIEDLPHVKCTWLEEDA